MYIKSEFNNIFKKEIKMISTHSTKPADIERKWYVVDASGVILGRLSAEIAKILRGKNKPYFTPNLDCGDYVVIVNAAKAVLTGKKLTQKMYRHHTGYVGHLKEINYKTLMAKKPEFAMKLAIKGMLPANTVGAKSLTRCHIYAGANHKQQAQAPEAWVR